MYRVLIVYCFFIFPFYLSFASYDSLVRKYTNRVTSFTWANSDSMLFYVKKIESIAKETSDELHKGIGFLCRGMYHDDFGSNDSTLFFYGKAESIFKKVESNYRLGIVYNNIGFYFFKKSLYDSALSYYQKSLPFSISADSSIYSLTLCNMAEVHQKMGDSKKALEYFNQALNVANEVPSPTMILKASTGIATAYLFVEPRRAIEILEHFIPKVEVELYQDLAESYNLLGAAYFLSGDLANAIANYSKAIQGARSTGVVNVYVSSLLNAGECLGALGKTTAALDTLEKAKKLSLQNGYGLFLLEGFKYQISILEKSNRDKATIAAYKNYKKAEDSIKLENQKRLIIDLETKYQTEQKERQIAEQDLEIATQQSVLQKQRIQIGSLGAGLVIVLLVGFVIYNQVRTKQKSVLQEAVIAEQEKGLEAVFNATEEERKRIAKDLHDGVGQQLSALKRGFETLVATLDNQKKQEAIRLKDLVDETARDTRDISHQMMPRALTELGMIPAIEDSLNKTLNSASIKFEFEHYNLRQRYEERREVAIYRILQELVNNVIKHSGASQVNIQLFENQSNLILIVEDNGKGLKDSLGDGVGILNIKSRINTFKGRVNLEPSLESGTIATVSIPV